MDNGTRCRRPGHVLFFRQSKNWKKESEFGVGIGAHGGVWECPDLIPFIVDGKKIWLLIVSINPGGLQGGSGTQYFTGNFDGHVFTCNDTITRWMDYGPDNYAGVTFSNTGKEKIFLGWMSNWLIRHKSSNCKMEKCHDYSARTGFKKNRGELLHDDGADSALEKLVIKTKTYSHDSD